MAFKLKGKEEKFFSILENHAELTYESAEMMERVFKGEVSKEEAFLEIDTKEKAADELVNETVDRLRKTFITPMDREDIQLLIDQLDTTLDNIKEIMDKMVMYHRRSLVETKMHCIKLLGDKLSARSFDSQVNEIHARVAVLNRFTELGRPLTQVTP